MSKHIFAYTAMGSYPAHLSITQQDSGSITANVRSEPRTRLDGLQTVDSATIVLPEIELRRLAAELRIYLDPMPESFLGNTPPEFKTGDIVKLKGQSTNLTVLKASGGLVHVAWEQGYPSTDVARDAFPSDALQRVS